VSINGAGYFLRAQLHANTNEKSLFFFSCVTLAERIESRLVIHPTVDTHHTIELMEFFQRENSVTHSQLHINGG
jgi:hypothetical protein